MATRRALVLIAGVVTEIAVADALGTTNLTTTGNTILGDASTDTLNIGNGGLIKDASGNVGIGLTPTYRLDVLSASAIPARIASTSATLMALMLADANTTVDSLYIGTVGNNFRVVTNNVERMRIDASGNLGIGAVPTTGLTSIGPSLQIKGSSSSLSGALIASSADGGSSVAMYSGFVSTDNPAIAYQKDLRFGSATNIGVGGYVERMRIDASGNLLVGTTSCLYSQAARGVVEINGASNSILGLKVGGLEAGYLYHDGTNLLLNNTRAAALLLLTNQIERMRIDASGNVGIGGAPAGRLGITTPQGTAPAFWLTQTSWRSWSVSVGASPGDPAFIVRDESSGTERMRIDSGGTVTPGGDNTQTMGSAAKRWSTVYAGTGAINTSDARDKSGIAALTAPEIEAARLLAGEVGTYRWNDAVRAKGEGARRHVGMTVQRAIEILQAQGLDATRYAFICHDEWPAEGDAPAGDRYSFRPDELLLFLARGFDARLARLETPLH